MKKYISLILIILLCAVILPSCVIPSDAPQYIYSPSADGEGWSISGIRYPSTLIRYITIPEKFEGKPVREIASGGFSGIEGVALVSIPSSVRLIDTYAFGSCEYLATVELAEGVERIEGYAFANCQNLLEVSIPSTVSYIGEGAFGLCLSLGTIKYNGTIAEWESIEKADGWYGNIATFTRVVSCTDGVVYF